MFRSPKFRDVGVGALSVFLVLASLGPSTAAGVINGRVVDEQGQGVQGVDIDVKTLGGVDVEDISADGTNAQGQFSTTVPDGLYTILFNPPTAQADALLTVALETVAVSGTVQLGVIELPAGVLLSGRVVDGGGQPVAGVDLDVVELASGVDLVVPGDNSGVDGRFEIAVPTTSIEVQFETALLAGPLLAPTSMTLQTDAPLDLGDVTLAPGLTLQGSVHKPGGVPVVGADLDVFEAGTQQRLFTPQDNTNGAGHFQVVVPAGSYDLRVDPPLDAGVLTGFVSGVDVAGPTDVGVIELVEGELGFPIVLGDRYEGALDASDLDAVSFDAAAETRVNLVLERGKGSQLAPSLRLIGPDDQELVAFADSVNSAKSAGVKKFVLPASGSYRVELAGVDGSTGSYRLLTKASPKRSYKAELSVPDDAQLVFGALAGWTLKKLTVKAKTGKVFPAPLMPTLTLSNPTEQPIDVDDLLQLNPKGTKLTLGALMLLAGGDHVVTLGGDAASVGSAVVQLKLGPAKHKAVTWSEP